ncbi:phosphatase PAP2 family protein [Caballeronia ptereochthonis]|uniref:PA-phosphatase like phosphoesterase n=1 Tax=Caballeronia ptereochthonis TaxID=1777144 RepID=A0A158E8P3_9BURK|nr:phosphatase PAP2 family protein [Caballeronia ptereochthonis]SAL03239.1 PA-phosphatase like phosphoesterase [Caballeronia ptereochthonis]
MNAFDTSIQTWLVHFAASSVIFTHAVHTIADLYLAKGLLPLGILWAIWFKPGDSLKWRREMVVATLFSGIVAFILGRFLALYLPFRLRPVYDPNIHLTFPMTHETSKFLRTWSSFPSDHAALWMAIAVGIFFVWRWIGILAILQCVLLVCLPRVYLGLHYPTDVIAGAIIGAFSAWLVTRAPLRTRLAPPFLRFMDSWPAVGYMLAFLFFFELATMFDEPRFIAISVIKAL